MREGEDLWIEKGAVPLLLGIIVALLGYFGLMMQGDLDDVISAERATSDAVKALQVELVREVGSTNRRLDAIALKLDTVASSLPTDPR